MTPTDRLQHAKTRPIFIEDAVRTALREVIAWRIGGGNAPGSDAFVTAAIAAARLELDRIDGDSTARSRTLASVQSAAHRFSTSALCRRLFAVPASQLLRLSRSQHGPDAIVRDRGRRLHAIVLTVRPDPLAAGRIATRIASETPLSIVDRLTPLTVHVFSLASGKRHTFERHVFNEHAAHVAAHVA